MVVSTIVVDEVGIINSPAVEEVVEEEDVEEVVVVAATVATVTTHLVTKAVADDKSDGLLISDLLKY